MLLAFGGLVAATFTQFTGQVNLPPGATLVCAAAFVLLAQVSLLLLISSFAVLSTRDAAQVLPIRDYRYYVAESKGLLPLWSEVESHFGQSPDGPSNHDQTQHEHSQAGQLRRSGLDNIDSISTGSLDEPLSATLQS